MAQLQEDGADTPLVEAAQEKVTAAQAELRDAQAELPQYSRQDRHIGSLFFALPDGTSIIMYRLVGEATAPKHKGPISETTPAKSSHVVRVPLHNWLKSAQRFRVEIRPGDAGRAYSFRGADRVDVPALNDRDYKLTFYGYTTGKATAAVVFTNEATGEYIEYGVEVDVTEPGVMRTIPLFATVRQSVTETITVENPLPKDESVAFAGDDWWKCDDPNVRVRTVSPVTLSAEGVFEVEYRPLVLHAGDGGVREVTLTLQCEALGSYIYTLQLKATPTKMMRPMHFTALFGSEHVQSFRFKNFLTRAEDYNCEVSQPLIFGVAAQVKAEAAEDWEGCEFVVEVKFKPQALGAVRDTLTISSADGGQYFCTLHGLCDPDAQKEEDEIDYC